MGYNCNSRDRKNLIHDQFQTSKKGEGTEIMGTAKSCPEKKELQTRGETDNRTGAQTARNFGTKEVLIWRSCVGRRKWYQERRKREMSQAC